MKHINNVKYTYNHKILYSQFTQFIGHLPGSLVEKPCGQRSGCSKSGRNVVVLVQP